ncbi:hypothetical protein J5N97_029415 [Dioscorea zingiberensis]|uniref:Myb-like domain-containing protein n=1 Tax=Dioscorea zingiberensis TaxID=325984 RepID=A0A9D5H5T7_9LILI|nr:hypothetical protein J5N97_029415 [Dioscorea zingiberensis]
MQSGYGAGGGGGGGVSEIQQFMVEGCPSSASTSMFSMSSSSGNLHPHQHHPLQPPPHHFPHFHSIPITQQLFHQAHHFQLFSHQHHQELGLDLESGPENSTSPNRIIIGGATGGGSGGGGPPPSFLTAAMSFKLGVNDNSAGTREGLNEDEPLQLHRDDGSPWQQREEESTIKEPFWRPLDIDYINRNNKRTNEKQQQLQESSSKYCKKVSKEGSTGGHQEQQQGNNNGTNYKLFSELEAIYKPGNSVHGGGGDAGGSSSANNQTGSGSALTGDENPLMTLVAPGPIGEQHLSTINQGSDTSTGEEAPVKKHAKSRRRRKRRQQLSSVVAFFENLVKQLMDHQEGLHRRFLEVVEKRDQERVIREETWRKEEAAKSSREAALRAQERVITSTRETAIISFLEKITGETLNLPTKVQFQSQQQQGDSQKDDNTEPSYDPLDLSQEFLNSNNNNNNSSSIGDMNNNRIQMNTSRWPKAEVQALIRVRSSLETRFQEPGLKGPLWEEVSSMMASMGYSRSSKRCKEKWENINKYFRKTKESGKKRPMHSKTCPYFQQLDQLYSKTVNKQLPPPPTTEERKDNSELLDAIVLPSEHSSFKMNLGEEGDEGTDHDHGEKEEEEDNGKHHQIKP